MLEKQGAMLSQDNSVIARATPQKQTEKEISSANNEVCIYMARFILIMINDKD